MKSASGEVLLHRGMFELAGQALLADKAIRKRMHVH